MTAIGEFFPRRVNLHVPNAQYAADVSQDGFGRISFGTPAALNASGIYTFAAAQSVGTTYIPTTTQDTQAKFGRIVTVTNAGTGGGSNGITIRGYDYLGQPIVETITGTAASAVSTVKAFKYVTEITGNVAEGATIGWSNALGLPYKAIATNNISGYATKAGAAPVQQTASPTVGFQTTDQTATTADPRGTWTPTTAPDGVYEYNLVYNVDRKNLHGNKHYSG